MIFSGITGLYIGPTTYSKAYVGEKQVWPNKMVALTKITSFSELNSGDTYVLVNEENKLVVTYSSDWESLGYTQVVSGNTQLAILPPTYAEFVFDKTYTYSSEAISQTTVANIIYDKDKSRIYVTEPDNYLGYLTKYNNGHEYNYIWLVSANGTIQPYELSYQSGLYGLYNGDVHIPYTSFETTGTTGAQYSVYKLTKSGVYIGDSTLEEGDKFVMIEPNNKMIVGNYGSSNISFSEFDGSYKVYSSLPSNSSEFKFNSQSHAIKFSDGVCANSGYFTEPNQSNAYARLVHGCSSGTYPSYKSGNKLSSTSPRYTIKVYLSYDSSYGYPRYLASTSFKPTYLIYKIIEF